MAWSSLSAVASAVIALVAVVVNVALFRTARRAEDERARQQRMPVLVSFGESDGGIRVTNVGWGPALNVFMASWRSDDCEQRIPLAADADVGGNWFHPVHLQPVPVGGVERIPAVYRTTMVPGVTSFGIIYTDQNGQHYTTTVSDEGTIVRRGNLLPPWPGIKIPYPGELHGA
ncbi:hypothetical protein ACIOD2_00020 [Amycolatopsis sp. NPDC088138]|uniref:hypothetical protein n=1 Tax=Amycolatopsis sp. NPDC088138 TaxID=3363938 RepID=UPI00381092E1